MSKRVMRILPGILIAIVSLMSVIAANCQDESNVVEISLPIEKNHFQVNNPEGLQLCLCSSSNGKVLATIRRDQKSVTFLLPLGNYFVKDLDSKELYPAPVLHRRLAKQHPVLTVQKPSKKTDRTWAYIPAGPAIAGDTLGVGAPDERPVRISQVKAFWLERREVTNLQFANFLSEQTAFDERWIDLESRKCLIQKERQTNGTFRYAPDSKTHRNAARMPVVMVSKFGAEAYCRWLTQKTGQVHRLPTEVEWEKAARGPFTHVYSYGDRYRQSGANQESGYLKPVATYRGNGFGLFDMTGNVFEWTQGKFNATKKTDIMNHTLRGGSFVLDGMYLRNSFRMRQSPSVMTDDIGFRVLREVRK